MATQTIQNKSAKNLQKILKDKREALQLQAAFIALQQDNANLWAAINAITLQLDTNSVAGHPYNPANGGTAVNLPATNNDQTVTNNTALVYNNAGLSSLHLQP